MTPADDELEPVTLSLSPETLRKARRLARQRKTSLGQLLAALIEEIAAGEDRYAQAQARHLALLAGARDLGSRGRSMSRDVPLDR